jgi:hypothetical protein
VVMLSMKQMSGAYRPPASIGTQMTETLNHFSSMDEVVSPVPPSGREQGHHALGTELCPSGRRPGSLDDPTEQAYLLRERMTLLQSRVELARAQLSTMRSGKASKDLYARVFVPLMHEFEETSRRYEAVTANDPRRRRNERPAASGRRHRRPTWPPLHRFLNVSR